MFDLKAEGKSFEIPLFGDRLVLTVQPMTTAGYYASQTAATRRLEKLQENFEDARDSGLLGEGVDLDLDDEDTRNGIFTAFYIQELAVRHIKAWTGVFENGKDVEPTPDRIRALVSKDPIGKRFYEEFSLRNSCLFLAKKDSGPCVSGTTDKVQTTAEGATNSTSNAHPESPE